MAADFYIPMRNQYCREREDFAKGRRDKGKTLCTLPSFPDNEFYLINKTTHSYFIHVQLCFQNNSAAFMQSKDPAYGGMTMNHCFAIFPNFNSIRKPLYSMTAITLCFVVENNKDPYRSPTSLSS
jgi:hypothetical protein